MGKTFTGEQTTKSSDTNRKLLQLSKHIRNMRQSNKTHPLLNISLQTLKLSQRSKELRKEIETLKAETQKFLQGLHLRPSISTSSNPPTMGTSISPNVIPGLLYRAPMQGPMSSLRTLPIPSGVHRAPSQVHLNGIAQKPVVLPLQTISSNNHFKYNPMRLVQPQATLFSAVMNSGSSPLIKPSTPMCSIPIRGTSLPVQVCAQNVFTARTASVSSNPPTHALPLTSVTLTIPRGMSIAVTSVNPVVSIKPGEVARTGDQVLKSGPILSQFEGATAVSQGLIPFHAAKNENSSSSAKLPITTGPSAWSLGRGCQLSPFEVRSTSVTEKKAECSCCVDGGIEHEAINFHTYLNQSAQHWINKLRSSKEYSNTDVNDLPFNKLLNRRQGFEKSSLLTESTSLDAQCLSSNTGREKCLGSGNSTKNSRLKEELRGDSCPLPQNWTDAEDLERDGTISTESSYSSFGSLPYCSPSSLASIEQDECIVSSNSINIEAFKALKNDGDKHNQL